MLRRLFDLYGSDKGSEATAPRPYPWEPHTYAEVYASLFSHCRASVRKVFECGLGTNSPDFPYNMTSSGKPGASLRAWRDYFPSATIYGADIDECVLFQEDRIQTFQVDQTSSKSIQSMWKLIGTADFDLMIDDGLHEFAAGTTLFEQSVGRLAAGGVYVIEDVSSVDLEKYSEYFQKRGYWVTFVQCPRGPRGLIRDNSLVLVRKPQ